MSARNIPGTVPMYEVHPSDDPALTQGIAEYPKSDTRMTRSSSGREDLRVSAMYSMSIRRNRMSFPPRSLSLTSLHLALRSLSVTT